MVSIEKGAVQIDAARERGAMYFRHAGDGEIGQCIGLDDLFDIGASQATDGAKRSVPKELGPLDLLNVVTELTRDFRRR